MGMNFANLIIPTQYSQNNFNPTQINMNRNFEIEIPNYDGYYYNIQEDCVYSTKKGTKLHYGRNKMKIYNDKDGNKFVYLLRSTDNYRGKVYLSDVREKIYKMFMNNINDPMIFPGIIYDEG